MDSAPRQSARPASTARAPARPTASVRPRTPKCMRFCGTARAHARCNHLGGFAACTDCNTGYAPNTSGTGATSCNRTMRARGAPWASGLPANPLRSARGFACVAEPPACPAGQSASQGQASCQSTGIPPFPLHVKSAMHLSPFAASGLTNILRGHQRARPTPTRSPAPRWAARRAPAATPTATPALARRHACATPATPAAAPRATASTAPVRAVHGAPSMCGPLPRTRLTRERRR